MDIYINYMDEFSSKVPILLFLPSSALSYPDRLALFFFTKDPTTLSLTNSSNKYPFPFTLEHLEFPLFDHPLTNPTISLYRSVTNVLNFLYRPT